MPTSFSRPSAIPAQPPQQAEGTGGHVLPSDRWQATEAEHPTPGCNAGLQPVNALPGCAGTSKPQRRSWPFGAASVLRLGWHISDHRRAHSKQERQEKNHDKSTRHIGKDAATSGPFRQLKLGLEKATEIPTQCSVPWYSVPTAKVICAAIVLSVN